MIARSFDGAFANRLVNHPDIRPFVGGDPEQPLDLQPIVENDWNYFLTGPAGGFLGVWTAPETYEVHTFILPSGRGPKAASLARLAITYMVNEGARHLWTRVARDARNVRMFTLRAGFRPCGEQTLDLGIGPVLYDLFNWRA